MLKRPPEHAVDAAPKFIWIDDPAWDTDRIDKERRDLDKERRDLATEPPTAAHPVDAYMEGETRYDLDAQLPIGGQSVPVTNYLNGIDPTVFHLQRVSGKQWLTASAALGNGNTSILWDLARQGVVKIEDGLTGGTPWLLKGGGPVELTENDLQGIFDISASLVQAIGLAVYRASKPLTEVEGKL